ncbi:MAG: DsbC family protein [Thiotrichales bacterium]|nr:DsbC family protein [Thiotrichales bacterium]
MTGMKKITLAVLAATISFGAIANDELANKMRAKFPGTPIDSAQYVDGIPGLVEMIVGKNKIIYTSEAGDKVVIGHIYDTKTNTDLTQNKINSLSKIEFDKLPFQQSFTVKKGDGSREFAVFTDVDCPYCRKLEQELSRLDNYTMHVFLFPLEMHKDAKARSEAIWCSTDRAKNFQDYMKTGLLKVSDTTCDTSVIAKNVRFGFDNGISGTPNLIGKNGTVVPGFMPSAKLDAWLNQNGK